MELQKWKFFQHLDPIFAADVQRAYLVGISSTEDDGVDDDDEDAERGSIFPAMDDLQNTAYSGGVVVMENDDVYFLTRYWEKLSAPGMYGTDYLLPFVPKKITALCGQQIRAVSSGHEHSVVLTDEGRMYQWEHIYYVQKMQHIRSGPALVAGDGIENERVIQIACGQRYTVALTVEGDVYTWGSNCLGQLGNGRDEYGRSPTKISGLNGFDAKISMVACAEWASFALDKDGTVWSWGDSVDGALGYDASEPQKIPRKIRSLKNIKMIAAGNTHVLALSNKRELYFWGQHKWEGRITATPRKIEIPNVVFIGATRGCTISAFQTAKRKVYFWGFAYGHDIPDPVLTKFSTIAEVFASLDSPVMLEPVRVDVKRSLTEKLKFNLDDKYTGDVSFNVEGKIIYAHREVLKSRSDHFKRMFDNNWKEDGGKEVEIVEFSYQGFRAFLYYLYTDRIDPEIRTLTDAIDLLRLSDYYGQEGLKQRCEPLLEILITKDAVSRAYTISCQYNANNLHELALDFMIPNLNNVVETEEFQKMPDDLKSRLFQELAKEDALVGLKRRRNK